MEANQQGNEAPETPEQARRRLKMERARQWYERTVGKPAQDNPDNRSLASQGKTRELEDLIQRVRRAR